MDDVLEYDAPWIVAEPGPLDPAAVDALVAAVRRAGVDAALVLTSFHQSPLPLALLLRLAGVGWVGAISDDYPGSLLDLRHRLPETPADVPESERALSLARAAGFDLPGPATLAVRHPLPDVTALVGDGPYVVLHPGADAPARRPGAEQSRAFVAALVDAGHRVVVTGSPGRGRVHRDGGNNGENVFAFPADSASTMYELSRRAVPPESAAADQPW